MARVRWPTPPKKLGMELSRQAPLTGLGKFDILNRVISESSRNASRARATYQRKLANRVLR